MNEEDFDDFLNERLDGEDEVHHDDESDEEGEDELEKLLTEAEKEDEEVVVIESTAQKERAAHSEVKNQTTGSNEVVLQFWNDEEEDDDEDAKQEYEQNVKLAKILVKHQKHEEEDQHVPHEEENVVTSESSTTTTATTTEQTAVTSPVINDPIQDMIETRLTVIISNLFSKFGNIVDSNPDDLMQRQQQERESYDFDSSKLKPSLQRKVILTESAVENLSNVLQVTLEKKNIARKQRKIFRRAFSEENSKNAALTKKLEIRDQRLMLAKQRWNQERQMLLTMLKEKGVEISSEADLYNIDELDVIDDESDNANASLLSTSASPLVAASEIISSIFSSFSQPIESVQVNSLSQQQQPQQQQSNSSSAQLEETSPASVIDSFRGWMWGSSQQSNAVPEKSTAQEAAATRTKKKRRSVKAKTTEAAQQ
jgi:hypothetical protein